ncbi:MAG TPA: cytochrome c biogenesis protein CcdA [Intrasporangiaceae bacterium]|nr:cytochrome c biogenesis protein CcdA [Intrasporangiaceae bacterium]
MSTVTIPLAAAAGILSFASPCFLPIVPAYVTYVAGDQRRDSRSVRLRALGQASAFVAGFTLVFVSIWVLLGAIGASIADSRGILRIAAGAVLVVLGLHLAGWIDLALLSRTLRIPVRPRLETTPSAARSFVLGLAFAAGWTPCVGPILAAVIALATTTGSVGEGIVLLVAYSLGLGLPFVLVAVGADAIARRMAWLRTHQRAVSTVSGVFLISVGFLMITDRFERLAALVPAFGL